MAIVAGGWLASVSQADSPVWIAAGSRPAVAAANGDALVVWQQDDGDEEGVYARLYNGFAMPQGTEMRVNANVAKAQKAPDTTVLAGGGYVVVWQGELANRTKVFSRRLDAFAMPQGTEMQVNTAFTALEPAVGSDSEGNYYVAWVQTTAANPALGSPVKFHHYLRAFDTAGNPMGGEVQFGEKSGLTAPAIAVLPSGDSLVVWEGKHADVRGQLFDRFAMPQGTEFRVNVANATSPLNPAVTIDGDGDFLVAWEGSLGGGQRGVLGRRVERAFAMPQGTEMQVSVTPFEAPAQPAAAVDASGNMVVTWQCILSEGAPHGEVIARLVNDFAMPQGTEFVVNAQPLLVQQSSDVASDGDGGFVVVWEVLDDGVPTIYGEAIDVMSLQP